MFGILHPAVLIEYLGDTVVVYGNMVVNSCLKDNVDSFGSCLVVVGSVLIGGSVIVDGTLFD